LLPPRTQAQLVNNTCDGSLNVIVTVTATLAVGQSADSAASGNVFYRTGSGSTNSVIEPFAGVVD
jgi:hypothetical protein